MKIYKAKTRSGKKFLENRAPKVFENDKQAIIVKGGKTSEIVTNILLELYQLKKPLATLLKRRNPFHLFEDETGVEKFSQKFDSSLFVFGSNSKKRPNSLIFGRMYDYHVLDMAELLVENYVPSKEFHEPRPTFGVKPCILLQGTLFESDETLKRVGNLMVDWFQGAKANKIRLQGLELIISLTATEGRILLRTYRTALKKSASATPRVELIEIGPSINFLVHRNRLASENLFREALKQPKESKIKMRKNVSQDVFGTTAARIHIGKQNTEAIQTRKIKALKQQRKVFEEEED